MKDLQFLVDVLKSRKYKGGAYYIPGSWNYLKLDAQAAIQRAGEVSVDPYRFYATCLETILHAPAQKRNTEIKSSVMYTMSPETFSAWDHTGKGVESGTFLKAIALLPLLIQRGIDIICLQPIFMASRRASAEASPYAVKDLMKIDPALHDSHLSGITPEDEFYAFVQACHHLGIKVMMEFVFRRAARDNVLIRNHPEWFYWVQAGAVKKMTAPEWPENSDLFSDAGALDALYQTEEMKEYVSRFAEAPDRADWKDVVEESDFLHEDLLSVSARRLKIETAPAFAESADRSQPTIQNGTYYRMFFDNTPAAVRAFAQIRTPFLTRDGLYCKQFPGKLPNYGLWRFLESVIPYYQETYGIDGACLDREETLPSELVAAAISRAREQNSNFLFWSGEQDAQNAYDVADEGYDFIRGSLAHDWAQLSSDDFGNRLFQHVDSVLPVTAALERADAPVLQVMGSWERVEAAFWIAALIPNSILLFRSGMEMEESEVRGGLSGQKKAADSDSARPASLNWLSAGAAGFCEDMLLASQFRRVYRDVLQPENLDLRLLMADTPVLVLKYQTADKQFLAVINRTEKSFQIVPERLIEGERKILYSKRASVNGAVGEYGVLIIGSLVQTAVRKPGQTELPSERKGQIEAESKTDPKTAPDWPPRVEREVLPHFTRGETNEKRVACFSMEFGLDAALETYAGSVGILSGDILKTAADMGKPIVGVGILWRQGAGHQLIRPDGTVIDCFPENQYQRLKDTGATVTLPIRGRDVLLKIWLCDLYANAPLYLLDSSLAVNGDDRLLTGQLYGRFEEERVAQEMILGIGGVMALQTLGIEVDVYHLNDSHAVLAGVKLVEDQIGCGCLFEQAVERTREKIVFTSHAPVILGAETHPLELLQYMGAFGALSEREIVYLGGNPFNMVVAGLCMSYIASGLSVCHSRQLRDAWSNIPGAPPIVSITGGLHVATWMDRSVAEAVQRKEGLFEARRVLKKRLFAEIARQTGRSMKENVLTVGMAHMVSVLHRNDLIFRDFDSLEPLVMEGKLQIVMAGKAHPADLEGKRILTELHKWSTRYPEAIVFLQDYDIFIGRKIAQGCDVWLNTSVVSMEVCDVSGIKAAMNGTLPLSVKDGWWAEACEQGVNGWQFGNGYTGPDADEQDSAALLDILREVVVPLYYKNADKWMSMMYAGITVAYKQFSSVRMLREYYTKLYKLQET